MPIAGAHDPALVALSVLVAAAASFTALDLAGRISATSGMIRLAWLTAAAVALGGGIWSMHFIAMLAFSMPGMEVHYDVGLTLLSFVLPIAVTGAGFLVVDRRGTRPFVLALSGILMGAGIVAMHYTGMAAMRMEADLSYDALWVSFSILIAIGASIVALWIAFRKTGLAQKLLASGIMGLAISGMHYTAMQAAVFTSSEAVDRAKGHASIGQSSLALAVAGATFMLLMLGIAAVSYDRRLARLLEREQVARRESALAEAYRKGEALKTAILEAALDCIITITDDSCIVEWNPAAERTFGYPRSAALGQDLAQLIIPPELQERHYQGVAHYLATGESPVLGRRIELEALRADGSRFPVELAISSIHIEGQPHFTAYLRDISERKQTEAALHRSEEQYRLLAENASDLIVRLDLSGCRHYVSAAARDMLGYEPEELISKDLIEHVHPDDRQLVVAAFEELASGQVRQQTITYRHKHKDGRWIQVESRRRLMLDMEGGPVEVVAVIRDITARVQLEDQLRQSQKMEAVGQLTGGIAHDFNNLLTVILGNAEVLVEDTSNPALTQTLSQQILEAAGRGADLTQHLLAFGRRQSLKPVRVSLDHVVEGMMPLLQRSIGEHIELRTDLRYSLFCALTDRTLLESAILNLVVNARDAMPQGGMLTIATGEAMAAPGQGQLPIGQNVVSVTVSDTGTGMSAAVLSQVFEPFYTTKEVGKGSGLGLSMVYGFAQQSGGHVSIKSREGEGTSVTILLPAIDSRSLQPSAKDEGASAPAGGQERILLVEDEPQVLQFVSAQLVSLGYEVTAVSTGPDALDLLRQGDHIDLLFTDIVLPKGMSGVELARRARQIRPELKVLLTSGYPEGAFEQHGRPDENIPLLRKPYKRKELAETFRRLLET